MPVGSWALWNVGLAGVLGAAGVALSAVAAHRVADPGLATAALFLVLHGAAVVGLSALAGATPWPAVFLAAASLMIFAVTLFSGDVVARALLGGRLFPMAAPTGGSLLILAWSLAGLAGIVGAIRSGP